MQSTQLRQKLVFPINPRKKIGQYIQFPLPICWTVGRQAEERPIGRLVDDPKHYIIKTQRELSRSPEVQSWVGKQNLVRAPAEERKFPSYCQKTETDR